VARQGSISLTAGWQSRATGADLVYTSGLTQILAANREGICHVLQQRRKKAKKEKKQVHISYTTRRQRHEEFASMSCASSRTVASMCQQFHRKFGCRPSGTILSPPPIQHRHFYSANLIAHSTRCSLTSQHLAVNLSSCLNTSTCVEVFTCKDCKVQVTTLGRVALPCVTLGHQPVTGQLAI
jgi:hypothetical protein